MSGGGHGHAKLPLTGCVLAGGKSSRMGRDKAALEVDGQTLAARAVGRLRGIFERVIVAANDPRPFAGLDVEVVPDRLGEGPLAGIAAALAAAATEHTFCCAVDMPFIEPSLVRHLCALAPGHDVVCAPGEPLLAVYSARCRAPFEAALAAGRFKLDAAFSDHSSGLRVRAVDAGEVARHDPGGRSFVNVNTPEEFSRVKRTQATAARRPGIMGMRKE